MSKRTGIVRRLGGSGTVARAPQPVEPQLGGSADLEAIAEVALPRDYPKWARDRFIVTAATQTLLARLRPIAIRLLGFWDHRIHRLEIGHGTIEIDDSGAYRSV